MVRLGTGFESLFAFELLELIKNAVSKGPVYGYGSSARSNTMLSFCGVDSKLIRFIVDKSPLKLGKFTPGTRIPIKDIKKLIIASIPDAIIEINDLMGDNNHYSAKIKSKVFNGLSKIEQHKLVYKSLKGKMGNELHALSITTEEK